MVMTSAIKSELMTCRDIVATGRYPYTGRFGVLSDNDWEKVDEAIAMVHAEEVSDHDFQGSVMDRETTYNACKGYMSGDRYTCPG